MRKFHLIGIAVASLMAGGMAAAADDVVSQPVAPVRPVTETYFGTAVTDNYRYMEDLKNPEVQSWMKGQANYTRATLDAIPGRAALLDRIHSLSNVDIRRAGFIRRGERYFYQVRFPGAQLPKLYYRDGLKGEEHLLLDPAKLGEGTKTHYSLDYYMPSWDGKRLAYGVSAGGSEASTLHLMDVATGKTLGEAIDRTPNDVIGWRADNKSFFYLRYAKPTPDMPANETEFNARTYLHVIGQHENGDGDAVVFGRGVSKTVDVPEGQATYVITSSQSPYAIAVANHNMDENPATLFVAPVDKVNGAATPWHKLAAVEDGVTEFTLKGDQLYFISLKGASRGQVKAMSLAKPDLARAQVLLPQGKGVITNLAQAKEGLYVRELDGAVAHLKRVSFDGRDVHQVPVPFEGNLFLAATDAREAGALFNTQGWTQAPEVVYYDPKTDKSEDTGLIPPSKLDTSALESKEVFATSYDGTLVPLSLIYRKGLQLDGSHPVILEGYGSYGITLDPFYNPTLLAWAEHGGIFAFAHIRGGGEYGEDWHNAGRKLTKMNTIQDFIACGQFLVDQRYTAPKLLAGLGGSAGGITVGGALTWRPDLFGVILDEVGMSDTLHMELEPNGPPNVPEFGSTKTEEGFHALYAMGAYMHVHDGVPYPATMFVTGANDPRVAPWHMAKMAARTQAATTSKRPVLLRVDYDAGHGIGSTQSQREIKLADQWAFALWQMGDPAFQPAAKQ